MRIIIGLAALARSGKDTVASMLLKHENVSAFALADPLKLGCQALFGLSDEEAWADAYKEKEIPLWQMSPRQMFQQVGTDWLRNHNADHWLMRADRHINHPAIGSPSPTPDQLKRSDAPIRLAAQAFFGLSDEQTWDEAMESEIDTFWMMAPQQTFQLIKNLCEKYIPAYRETRSKLPVATPSINHTKSKLADIIIIKDIRFENEAEYLRSHNGRIWHIIRPDAEKVRSHSSEFGIKIKDGDLVIKNSGTLEELEQQVQSAWSNIHPTH
ncbi:MULTISPECIES: deoxynucleotide monophosphate kinase [Pseudomonas]|nr:MULTISPECIES: deoxynucleotide monophosphate kinase [Pseudomonas]